MRMSDKINWTWTSWKHWVTDPGTLTIHAPLVQSLHKIEHERKTKQVVRGCKGLFAIVLVDWNPGDQFNPVFFYEVPPKTQLLILLKGRVPHLLFFDIKLHIIWKKDSKNYFNMNRYITTHIRHVHGSWLKLGVKFVCYLTSRQVLNVKIKLFSIILHTLIVPKLHLHGVVVTDGSSLQVEKHGKQRWSEMFARKHCHVELNVFNIKCLTVS